MLCVIFILLADYQSKQTSNVHLDKCLYRQLVKGYMCPDKNKLWGTNCRQELNLNGNPTSSFLKMNECETIKSCFLSCHIRYKERFTQNGYNRYSCLRTFTHWKIHIRLYCKSIHLWCIKPFFNRDTFKSFVC